MEAAAADLPSWQIALSRARWRREEGDPAGALALYRSALAQAPAGEGRTAVRQVALRVAPLVLLPGAPPLDASDMAFLCDQARALPADPDRRRAEWLERLDLALLAGRGGDMLEAWLALIPQEEGGIGKPLAPLARAFLPRAFADPAARADLVHLLAASRLHMEAAWVARTGRLDAAEPREEMAYAVFLDTVRRLTDDYYQRVSMGKGDRSAWEKAVEGAERQLAARLDPARDWSRKTLEATLAKRFGACMIFDITSGVYDLHYGHVIRDETWKPSQYGRTLDDSFRLVTLDFEVSNGYETWLWDHDSSHGGWADAKAITQWATDNHWGARMWSTLMDGQARAAWEQEQARLDARDRARPHDAPMTDLQGLRRRLEHKGATRLLARLEAQGLAGADLERAFIETCEDALFESGIVAHEGRHALDRASVWTRIRLTFNWARGLEYRAKLSEIAFAPIPFFAFGAILTDNVGDGSPHGHANARVLKGLGAWVEAHGASIPGYSAARPPWLQLDLLEADQLREAARSLDPWASDRGFPRNRPAP
jgi:hypothetical protein